MWNAVGLAVAAPSRAKAFVDFVNKSPSPFHAVQTVASRLSSAGFTELSEKDSWKIAKEGKYFVTRNNSAIVAFTVGGAFDPAKGGFTVTAAHTDSPCVRVKPISKRSSEGLSLVGSEWYGGLLAYTWFDRDLSVAGRVLVEQPDGSITARLVNVPRPILRIPSLAIHLNRGANDKFEVNKESHLTAVFASEAKTALEALAKKPAGAASAAAPAAAASAAAAAASAASAAEATEGAAARHHPRLLELIAEGHDFTPDQIVDFELCMYDTHPATLGGADYDFVFAPRLDNLLMSFCCTESLLSASTAEGPDGAASLAADANVRVVGLFDNEEVGSDSVPGAGSTFLEHVLRRVTASVPPSDGSPVEEAFMRAVRRSVLVSADMAHAVHPNYSDKHEAKHRPKMNCGLVVKHNTNQRYATTTVTSTLVRKAAKAAGAPVQEFVMRQDMGCGSTIGPILSTSLGMRTVDVGVAQLAMHSCREMCGSHDIESTIDVFDRLYRDFRVMDDAMLGTD